MTSTASDARGDWLSSYLALVQIWLHKHEIFATSTGNEKTDEQKNPVPLPPPPASFVRRPLGHGPQRGHSR